MVAHHDGLERSSARPVVAVWPDLVGRALIASLFWASAALDIIPNWPGVAEFVAGRGLPAPVLVGVGALAFEIVVPALLFSPRFERFGRWALAAYCVATAVLFHAFWGEPAGFGRTDAMFHFFKNVALCGALLVARPLTEPGLEDR